MTKEHRDPPVDEPTQAAVEDTEQQVAETQAPADEAIDTPDETAVPVDSQIPDEDQEATAEATDESPEESKILTEAAEEATGLEEPFEEDSWAEDASEPDEELDDVTEDVEDSAEPEDAEDEAAEIEEVEEAEAPQEQAPTVESVVEAILFATDEPLTDSRLANIVETTGKQVRDCIKALNEKYEQNHNAFRIEQIAGGYQMLTLSTYNPWLRKMLRARSDSKLSPAAMETLAIIAYKQPVIRVDIEAIRGVAVGEVIRSLMYKGLVRIVGRAEILGRPMLYGTTKKFLEVFGLNTLKDLPKAEELKKPD